MSFSTSTLWLPAMYASHRVANQVQVWDLAKTSPWIGSLPLIAGSVKDEWVSGIRRTLTLTLPPTDVVKNMIYPGVELRAFSGVNYGAGAPEMLPLGRFPLTDTLIGITPGQQINLTCTDKWSLVYEADFPIPRATNPNLTIQGQVVQFLVETGQWSYGQITNMISSTVKVPPQTYDTSAGGRSAACIALMESIGGEVFIDRYGNPVLQYRQTATDPVATFEPAARLKDLSVAVSNTPVRNVVWATSSSTDPALPVLQWRARIMDPSHPAYPRPGVPERTFSYTSPLFTTLAQVKNAAEKKLTKLSRMGRMLNITAAATDASLDASDTVQVTWPDGSPELGQLQTVEHSLVLAGSDAQLMTTVSSRRDEDFNP